MRTRGTGAGASPPDMEQGGWSRLERRTLSTLKTAEQSIKLDVMATKTIGEGEVEPGEEDEPSGLPGVESLGCVDVLQVLLISPHQKRQISPLEQVAPLLQGQRRV